jgi:hypothetical protein
MQRNLGGEGGDSANAAEGEIGGEDTFSVDVETTGCAVLLNDFLGATNTLECVGGTEGGGTLRRRILDRIKVLLLLLLQVSLVVPRKTLQIQ